MNSNIKTLIFWVVLICVAVLLFAVVHNGQAPKEQALSFTQFLDQVQEGRVSEVTITGSEVHGLFQGGSTGLATFIPANYPDVYNLLRDKKVNVKIKDTSSGNWISILVNASPFIVLLAFWIFMMRQMQSGGGPCADWAPESFRYRASWWSPVADWGPE